MFHQEASVETIKFIEQNGVGRPLAEIARVNRHCRHLKSDVRRILTENLDMGKLCARWVSRLLTMEQKTAS